jgi:hypothetical protein
MTFHAKRHPSDEAVLTFDMSLGMVKVVPQPVGTHKGHENLRRAATREHIANVGSVAELARMAAAVGRDQDLSRVPELRRILELEVGPNATSLASGNPSRLATEDPSAGVLQPPPATAYTLRTWC